MTPQDAQNGAPATDQTLGEALNPELRNLAVANLPSAVFGMLWEDQGVEAVVMQRAADQRPAAAEPVRPRAHRKADRGIRAERPHAGRRRD